MSEKLLRVDGERLVPALKKAGFEEQRQRGSHLHLRRPADGRRVTVPLHKGRTLALGTLRAILRDADIGIVEFRELL